jgi:phosphoglycolate phosphatase-like HAD superfamily hydrolase
VYSQRLFLFDIDGTLMRGAGPDHGAVLVEAIRHVLGVVTTMEGIPVHGMLDQDILTEMLARQGHAEQSRDALPEVIRHAQHLYPLRCPDLRAKVLPGVRETLEEIRAAGFPMGLVTGNLTAIGWCKLERAGLRPYFGFGAFAEMGETRSALARLAWQLAETSADSLVTLTGDAPSDVHAAKSNGFRSVAVATGMTSREELARLQPDLLLNGLSEPDDRRRLIHG